MTTYRASVRVDDDVLHTSRPLTAPEPVRDLIEWTVDRVAESGGEVTSVELAFETAGQSETPVGDSITATSSAPLSILDDDEDVGVTVTPSPATPAGAQA